MPRQPLLEQVVNVTAQAAIDRESNTGFSITLSKIMPYDDDDFRVYLGRPWRSYVRVIVMHTELSKLVDPRDWLAWNSSTDPPPPTVTLGEYQNYGPGSDVTKRVNWIGYTPIMTDEEAKKFTIDEFLNQKGWLQQTCVPYNGSM
ncbi:PREDICTED: pectinesterase 3-like [Camelina sativa]|uniref:Pectinesterase 3-like n=1 Tax=Camelina sativa TaxID=90675 RepID=A0ABM1RNL6_CAMSA|nr:PREDICTED: pectinesterase 3-like [Camelina sativa]